MDTNGIMLSTTTASTLLGIAIVVYRNVNHRRLRSNCCGRNLVMSVDVENTTPPGEHAFIHVNPLQRSTGITIPNP